MVAAVCDSRRDHHRAEFRHISRYGPQLHWTRVYFDWYRAERGGFIALDTMGTLDPTKRQPPP